MRRQVPGSPRQGLHMGNCSAPSLTSCSTPKVLEKMEQVLEDQLLQERKEHRAPQQAAGKAARRWVRDLLWTGGGSTPQALPSSPGRPSLPEPRLQENLLSHICGLGCKGRAAHTTPRP